MLAKMKAVLAAALVVASASVALADSVDGNPMHRTDRLPPASVRGSPAILFEDRGVLGPLDACVTDDAYGGTRSCGVGRAF